MTRRIDLTAQTWHALETLAWETQRPVNDLAEEAFSDLFKKRRRPRSLREALRDAARPHPFHDGAPMPRKRA
jgi:hypothetical protein